MRLAHSDADFRVYDDILPPARFRQVWRYLQAQNFSFVHLERWVKVWRLGDGSPLWGPEAYTKGAAESPLFRDGDGKGPSPEKVFPTGTPLDHVVGAVMRISARCTPVIGARPRDWVGISALSYLYPVGTGLSWHRDASGRTGAFIFYAHPHWNVTFGGELLVAGRNGRAAAGSRRRSRTSPHLDNQAENRELMATGVGSFVQAKPNRLVILRHGTPHMIKAVTPAAGSTVRCSVTGFFIARQ